MATNLIRGSRSLQIFERQIIALSKKDCLINSMSFHKTMFVGFSRGSLKVTRHLCVTFIPQKIIFRGKKSIDKSLVPELKENDLEERFIKGNGPGGSKVNKTVNCVYLLHKPTGLSVKVHEHREQYQNRKVARNKLINLLDILKNGENSVEMQLKNIEDEKFKKKSQKQKKLREKKTQWKETL